MTEIWKDVLGYEGLYEVSNKGRVRSVSHEAFTPTNGRYKTEPRIKKTSRHNGRVFVTLVKGSKRHKIQLARVIALAWVDGYADGLTVDHIDGDKTNNAISNLRWLSRAENTSESYKLVDRSHHIPVMLSTEEGSIIRFKTMYEADRFLGRKPGYLDAVLRNCPNPKAHSSDGQYYSIIIKKEGYHHA